MKIVQTVSAPNLLDPYQPFCKILFIRYRRQQIIETVPAFAVAKHLKVSSKLGVTQNPRTKKGLAGFTANPLFYMASPGGFEPPLPP
jgi:hypothetical protein